MTPPEILKQAFTLPCGTRIPNRIVKSAMSEMMQMKQGDRLIELLNYMRHGGRVGQECSFLGM